MSIYDEIKEITEQENKEEGKDVAATEREPTHADTRENPGAKEEPEEKPVHTKDAATGEPPVKPVAKPTEEKPKDQAKPAERTGEDPATADGAAPDNQTIAKLRYEAAKEKRRAEAAEARLREAPTQPQPGLARTERTSTEKRVLTEPDANLDPDAHLRWELQQTKAQLKDVSDWKNQKDAAERSVHLRDEAIKSYTSYEDEFKATVADYGDVTRFGIEFIKASLTALNPALKGEDLINAVKHKVLELGAKAEERGEQPAEFFYNHAKALGYKPKAADREPEPKAEPKNPSIKKIAEHKARSATSLTAGGRAGAAPLSKESVRDMGFSDFAKLSPAQLRQMEAMEE